MLTRLSIGNFRSIQRASVNFSPTGLTVIVGANGSGKSNLIRCLEFLGSSARRGVRLAVQLMGRRDAILPKALSRRSLRSTLTTLDYEVSLGPPPCYPSAALPILVNHNLAITHGALSSWVSSERLVFGEPLLIEQCLKSGKDAFDFRPLVGSKIEISRSKRAKANVSTTPEIDSQNLPLFLAWFGLGSLLDTLKQNPEVVVDLLSRLIISPARDRRALPGFTGTAGRGSLLHPSTSSLSTVSPQVNVFVKMLSDIKRYDLQLAELRRQQDITAQAVLSTHGAGLPSTLNRVKRIGRRSGGWNQLLTALREIAPQVLDTDVRSLQSGQEFVQFVEHKSGRPVESWHESDGTLRALGVIVALETHPEHGVILIEEPEQGLHPWAVKALVDHMRNVIKQRGIQVVLTTHSQQVLDNVEPEEVRVAVRSLAEGTTFASVAEIAPGHELERGEMGRLWVSGLLGGVPEPRRD